jgi:ATP-binding cassette subfamily B protein
MDKMSVFIKIIKRYIGLASTVIVLGIVSNGLALYVPTLSAHIIDDVNIIKQFTFFAWSKTLTLVTIFAVVSFILAIIQIQVSTFFSEKVALYLRHRLIDKISKQSFTYISNSTPGRLMTVLTSDIDAVKNVISQGLVTLLGAIITLIGSAVLLIMINTRLGLYTISVIPLLVLTIGFIFGTLTKLFREGQENLEKINSVINETIVGSALIRVLNSINSEINKFKSVNSKSRDIGLGIVKNISALIPAITLLANIITMIILYFGGKQVILGTLSVGSFSAFVSYSAMFIWPLFVLSFVGTSISRGGVSLKRINEVIDSQVEEEKGNNINKVKGDIEFKNVSLSYTDQNGNEKTVLKDISFKIKANTRNAIIGPTAAGKTQIFYLISGLVNPTSGEILIDGEPMNSYKTSDLLSNIGLVFQDSIVFNTTFRDNISFSEKTTNESLKKAINTAELDELVDRLPNGLDTMVSERGTSLSGGQKQRLMLARALALEPKILLLDDFTSRVDRNTEASILKNVNKNYKDVTLVSITQKIDPIKDYENIIVIMEGEVVAVGTHKDLIKNSFEYNQILESQMSTENISNKKDE